MKRIISYITTLAFAILLVAGCAKDVATETVGEGEGRFVLNLDFDGTILTRNMVAAPENVSIKIGIPRSDEEEGGYTHIYESLDALPEDGLWLANGNYFVEVAGGPTAEPADPGFDEKLYFNGRAEFTIASNEVTVNVPCTVSTTLVTIAFADSVPEWLTEYAVTLFPVPRNDAKTLVIDKDNAPQTVYANMAKNQTEMNWKFDATHSNEAEADVHQTGTLTDLAPGKHYTATFKYTYTEKKGHVSFEITVDDSTVDIPTEIIILTKPGISGVSSYTSLVPVDGHKITVKGSESIKSIQLSGAVFGTGYDVLNASDRADYGITLTQIQKGYELTLGMDFFSAVAQWIATQPAGDYPITISAVDQSDRSHSVTFKVGTTKGMVNPVRRGDIRAKRATVSGVDFTGGSTARFAYRPTSSGSEGAWTYVDGTFDGSQFKVALTGLTPNTEYEVDIEIAGELLDAAKKFTTEDATPIPNGGLESWYQSGNWYPNPQGGDAFWGTGNTDMGGDVTTPSNDVPSTSTGTKSAQLASKSAPLVGLAAGNIFSGKYVRTIVSISNPGGVVEFGKPFAARPDAMRLWYKAAPGTIDAIKSGTPMSSGDRDKYRIFIALADGNLLPHEVNTTDRNTFVDFSTHSDVIAYGELISDQAVDTWTELIIPLEYKSTSRIPNHIVIAASACMYGDYFTGSTSSKMFVDDFELIYE
jgi:hypothetical protein